MKIGVYSYIIACLCIFSLISCLKDAECHFSYQLRVKINGTAGSVDSVSLFVFNSDKSLRESINVAVDTSKNEVQIPLNHLPDGNYTYVVWGNLKGSQKIPDGITESTALDEACVCLIKHENGTHLPPDDLFHGIVSAKRDASVSKEDEITISRCVSGVKIKAYNLQGYYKATDTDFAMVVVGSLEKVPFVNNLASGKNEIPCSDVMPFHYAKAEWKNENELLESSLIYIFPSAESTNLKVNLYYKRSLIDSFEINSLAVANKVVEITLNFWNKDPEQWFNVLDWSSIEQEENI